MPGAMPFRDDAKGPEWIDEHFRESCQPALDQMPRALREPVAGALRRVLLRMDALARSEPFWHLSNGEPTIHKLPEFCGRVLKQTPNDEDCLWASVGLQLVHCQNPGGSEAWNRLFEKGKLDPKWPLLAAMYEWRSSGCDNSASAISLLRSLGIDPLPILREMANSGHHEGEWALRILTELR